MFLSACPQFLKKCFSSAGSALSRSQVNAKCNRIKIRNIWYQQYPTSYSTKSGEFRGLNQVKELLIPNEYGNIAAKAWGNEKGYPVLALHGWLDNCGTFDNLFPLLSDKFYIVAVDEPGHGKSSHKPPGCFYTDLSMIIDLKKVIDFLDWQRFSIIGHSFGGGISLMFASIFPSIVKKLVILDIVKPICREIDFFPEETRDAIKNYLEIEKKMSRSAPIYTEEAAAKRLQEGMHNEVTLENARILNKRGTQPSTCGNGFVFTRDLRCITIEQISIRSHNLTLQYMSAVSCELLMIMANNPHPNYGNCTPEVSDLFYDVYRKNAKKFVLQHVDGNHFVHLNNPEKIAPMINEFFSELSD